MTIFLSSLAGIIVTVMAIFNGQLSNAYGVYISTFIIHIIGLLTFIIILIIKKEKITFNSNIPFYLYLGGIIGILTVVFQVFSVNEIGVTLLTALGLLGQMLTSIILETKGWLGSIQKKLTPMHLLSIAIVIIGIGVMSL